MAGDILVVDDEADIRNLVRDVLAEEGYEVRLAANARRANEELLRRQPNLMLLDLWLEHSSRDGLDLFKDLRKRMPDLPIVLVSGHGTLETATEAIRNGAIDFIPKPFNSEILLHAVNRALKEARILREHRELQASFGGMIGDYSGNSQPIRELRRAIDGIADRPRTRVLISGAPGTGKAVTAWLIHLKSRGWEQPFITLQCGEQFGGRLFSEALFGVEASDKRYSGALERAHGGSVLMRHVDSLPPESQRVLLQALQRNYFRRLGGSSNVESSVRVMATSRRDLRELAAGGHFNKELYHRLSVLPVQTPPLNRRREDIGTLARSILGQLCSIRGWPQVTLDAPARHWLTDSAWPGNIWQLRAILESSLFLSGGRPTLDLDTVKRAAERNRELETGRTNRRDWYKLPLRESRREFERDYLTTLLERYNNNVSEVARHAKFERAALHRKLTSLEISRQGKE